MIASAYSSMALLKEPLRRVGDLVIRGASSAAAVLAASSLVSASGWLPRWSEKIACLESF